MDREKKAEYNRRHREKLKMRKEEIIEKKEEISLPKQEQMKAPPADNIEMTQEDYNEFIKWRAEAKKKQQQPQTTTNWASLLTMLIPPLIGVITRATAKTISTETPSEKPVEKQDDSGGGLSLAFGA
jgi:hypothetical protein